MIKPEERPIPSLIQRTEVISLGDGTFKVCPVGRPVEWLWVKDAAKIMGVSSESVRIWARAGLLKSRRVGLRKHQIEADSIKAFLEPYNHLK